MAINITSNYTNTQVSLMQKFHSAYKKSVDEKVAVPKNSAIENDINKENVSNDIREYLSIDEKKVLKEVFGDENLDKNTTTPYSGLKYTEFLKGTQLDIRL